MSAYANSLQKPESFESYVRKFRVICVMHGVQVGSPADLPAFLQKLINDRHLAMDFWGLVGKLSDREGGDLSDEQLLALVVEGIANSEVSPDNANLTRTVDDLRAMIAGVDVHGPGQLEPEPFSQSEKIPQPLPQPLNDRPRPSEIRAIQTPTLISSHVPPPPPPPAIPPQLDEALHRLELTNLELKHHLEEIDKRMSRLEPHPEPHPEPEPPAPAVIDAKEAKDAKATNDSKDRIPVAHTIPPEQLAQPEREVLKLKPLKPAPQPRLILEPPLPADLSFTGKSESRIPLETYSQPEGYGRVISMLILVLLLAAGSYAGYRYRAPLQKEISALFRNLQQKTAAAPANQSAAQVPPSTAETSPQPNPTQPNPIQPEAIKPTAPQPLPQHAVTAPPKHPVEASIPSPSPASSDAIPSSELAGAVRVAPSVMESLLYVSRVPAYPDGAKIQGIQGSVVMQAIISHSGSVKRVHVIQGDSRLRSSATEAVYKWRYHPYLINGQPVDVATTITVDFDLDQ